MEHVDKRIILYSINKWNTPNKQKYLEYKVKYLELKSKSSSGALNSKYITTEGNF